MITWEEHGRERIRARRATVAVSSVATTPSAAPSSVEVVKGVKRLHEGDQGTSGVGGGRGDIMSEVAAEHKDREKVLKTETGSASGAAAGVVSTSGGVGCGTVEGMTDSFTLNRSSVREYVWFVVAAFLPSWVCPPTWGPA